MKGLFLLFVSTLTCGVWQCALMGGLVAQGNCINGLVNGQWPCSNVELLAIIPNESTGGAVANDLWGWTDPLNGREYVLLGKRDGTWFIDVTNPKVPRIVGELPTTGVGNSLWRDVKVVGHHMVVVSEVVNSKMQVFDLTLLRDYLTISEPHNFSTDFLVDGFAEAHNVVVHEEDEMVFVCGSSSVEGLLIYDFSNPEDPTIVGSWNEAYVHDAQVVTYEGPDQDFFGRRIMMASCENDFKILDVTDPEDVVELASAAPDTYGYIHQGWLSDDHRFFFLGDESDEIDGLVSETTTYIFDVQDLSNPQLIASQGQGTQAADHNLFARGQFVHQSNYNDGYRLLNFVATDSDAMLQPKAHFDTQPNASNPSFDGSWSNYPFFNSGTIAVTDQENGLFLIRTQFITVQPFFAEVCPYDTLNLKLTIDECVQGPLSAVLPDGVSWISSDSFSGPGTWDLSIAGFDWSNISGITMVLEGHNVVHAARIYVDVTPDAAHYVDADGDGYGVYEGVVNGCSPGEGYAHVGGDCDDENAGVHPGIVDTCDGIDNDCDQYTDEDGETITFYIDIDGDGEAGSTGYQACTVPPMGVFVPGQDCNDFDATVYPGAVPTMMGIDNDCNGFVLGLEALDGGCPGDFNSDDFVSIQDLLTFLNYFGSFGFLEADLDFDQHVGVSDLLLMLSYLGNSC